jgi:hypothetical protein
MGGYLQSHFLEMDLLALVLLFDVGIERRVRHVSFLGYLPIRTGCTKPEFIADLFGLLSSCPFVVRLFFDLLFLLGGVRLTNLCELVAIHLII